MPRQTPAQEREPEEFRARPREEWRTTADLPPISVLARTDPFFRRLEGYVRWVHTVKHGISELSVEVAPVVTFAMSELPAWERRSRDIRAANALLSRGTLSLELRALWALDALEDEGVLTTGEIQEFFIGGSIPPVDPRRFAGLRLFSRGWYAAAMLDALQDARRFITSADPDEREQALEAAVYLGERFKEYALKVAHEDDALRGERDLARRKGNALAANAARRKKFDSQRSEWALFDADLRRKAPKLSRSARALRIANRFGASDRTVYRFLATIDKKLTRTT